MPRFRSCVILPVIYLSFLTSYAAAQIAPQTAAGPSTPARANTSVGSGRNVPTARPMMNASAPPLDPGLVSQRAGGSMLRATLNSPIDPGAVSLKDVSYFAVPEPEPRTIKKHDLVTIIVNEISQSQSSGTTTLKKAADLDAKIDAFVRFSLSNFALKNAAKTTPEIKLEGTRDFSGDGSVNRSDSLTTRITAEVLDVKPNGTLVLQARQHIKTDEEEQMMILSGICRVEDVTPDNTVLSTQMFDKDVAKSTKGAVSDTNKRGWVPKLLDVINPF